MNTLFDEMTERDRSDYAELISVIKRNRQAYQEVIRAVIQIRDRRLYREHYANFENFCEIELKMSRRNVDKLAQAKHVADRIEEHAPAAKSKVKSRAALLALSSVPDEKLECVIRDADPNEFESDQVSAESIEESIARNVEPKPAPDHSQSMLPGLESSVLSGREIRRIRALDEHFSKIGSLDEQAAFLCRHFHDLCIRIAERITEG